jgi:hypothetical protein
MSPFALSAMLELDNLALTPMKNAAQDSNQKVHIDQTKL